MNKLIMLLMAAVLVAGCTGQTDGNNMPSGNGLSILSFTSDTDSQVSSQDVRLLLTVENGGGSVIDAGKSLIYLMGSVGTGQWTFVDGTTTTQLTKNLNPYDPLKELPAGKADIKWRLKAPVLEAGQTRTDTFTARAYYDYETRVTGTIPVYSEAEAQAAKQSGTTIQKSEFTTTNGPISVSVRAIPDPLVSSADVETVTLELTVENMGGGTLYKNGVINSGTTEPDLKYDDLNKVYLEVVSTDTNLEIVDAACRGGYQDLIGGKPTTLTCDLKTKDMPSAKTVYPVKITMKYGYYIDQPLSVTVVGKRA